MRPLNARESKLVAVAILLALVAGAWALVIAPLADGFADRAQARRELLDRYRRNQDLLAAVPVLRAEAAAQRRSGARFHLVAASPTAAADALRARLTAVLTPDAAPLGAPALSPEVALETVSGGLPPGWVGVRADTALTLTRFVAAVRRLENEEPYVVVDYASLRTDAAASGGSAGANAGTTLGAGPAVAAPQPGTGPAPAARLPGGGGPLQVRLQISAPVRAPAAR